MDHLLFIIENIDVSLDESRILDWLTVHILRLEVTSPRRLVTYIDPETLGCETCMWGGPSLNKPLTIRKPLTFKHRSHETKRYIYLELVRGTDHPPCYIRRVDWFQESPRRTLVGGRTWTPDLRIYSTSFRSGTELTCKSSTPSEDSSRSCDKAYYKLLTKYHDTLPCQPIKSFEYGKKQTSKILNLNPKLLSPFLVTLFVSVIIFSFVVLL